ncbi:MAG TPA: DUF3761 domain-containing protein [Pyrinomonadaceae bacterium]|nr:DUF3761 domain-containing protein [Pyrinomonadaceae bacterium]
MKKQTHLQVTVYCLCLVLTVLALASPAYSSTPLSTQSRGEIVAAIVKSQKANLRDTPSNAGDVVTTVNKGDLLALIDATPIGPWYRVRDSKTESEGWVHGNTITLLQTIESPPVSVNSIQRPRRTSPPPASGRSYINVDGIRVPSPVFSETKPAGATARCRDGSYSFSMHRRGTCSHHGGVAEWF